MLTEQAKERRKKFLTASDIPAVIGMSPWKSPLQVYLEKTGQSEDFTGNEATQIGDDFEEALIFRAARAHKLVGLRRNQWRVAKGTVLAATLDSIGYEQEGAEIAIEAKTSGILSPSTDLTSWGESGTSQVPDRVAIQVQMQMYCAELPRVYVSALLGRFGHRTYVINRDDAAITALVDFCCAWWDKHVIGGIAPEATMPSDNSALRYVTRQVGKSIEIPSDLVADWQARKAEARLAEEAAELAEARVKASLGDAEIGVSACGQVSYREENAGARVDQKLLKEKFEHVYNEVSVTSKRRVLRFKEAK